MKRRVATPRRRDTGSADALGLALIAPAALGLALVLLLIGRGVDGRATAQNAAEAAAQAAARERTLAGATLAASAVASAMLVDDATCARPEVSTGVDGDVFAPGGVVRVTVSCSTSADGLDLVGAGGSTVVTAYAVIDTFRGVDG